MSKPDKKSVPSKYYAPDAPDAPPSDKKSVPSKYYAPDAPPSDPTGIPAGVLLTIAMMCSNLEGWQLVKGTLFAMTYILRRMPSWEILTTDAQSYPIIWINTSIRLHPPTDACVIAWAAEYGHKETVEALLEANAPVDENAIRLAAENGHTDIVKMLLEAKAPVDGRAITQATLYNHKETLKALREANAPVNVRDLVVATLLCDKAPIKW